MTQKLSTSIHYKSDKLVYILGIGGIAMANLACLLRDQGFNIKGSDNNIYSPSKELLMSQGIVPFVGFDASRLVGLLGQINLAVIGNSISRENEELEVLLESGIPFVSLPEAIRMFWLKDKKSIVVAGTHGKTTISSLIGYLLWCAKKEPNIFVGGVPNNFGRGWMSGRSEFSVIEGDEYDSSFFDKDPKFFHYAPFGLVITGVEFDHADMYRDLAHIRKNFRRLVELVNPHGFILAFSGTSELDYLLGSAKARIWLYGERTEDDFVLDSFSAHTNGSSFSLKVKNGAMDCTVRTSLMGRFNSLNIIASIACVNLLGIDMQLAVSHVESFRGVKRRQEVLINSDDFLFMEDFAHHPTAISQVIDSIKMHYPDYKIAVIFEPRSNTMRRNILQEELTYALLKANEIYLGALDRVENVPVHDRLDVGLLVDKLSNLGRVVAYEPDKRKLVNKVMASNNVRKALVLLSNGDCADLKNMIIEKFNND